MIFIVISRGRDMSPTVHFVTNLSLWFASSHSKLVSIYSGCYLLLGVFVELDQTYTDYPPFVSGLLESLHSNSRGMGQAPMLVVRPLSPPTTKSQLESIVLLQQVRREGVEPSLVLYKNTVLTVELPPYGFKLLYNNFSILSSFFWKSGAELMYNKVGIRGFQPRFQL